MEKDFKHVMFEIPAEQHRELKVMTIERSCSLKSLLQTAVSEYLGRESGRKK